MLELNQAIVSVYEEAHCHECMAEMCRATKGQQVCQSRIFDKFFQQWRSFAVEDNPPDSSQISSPNSTDLSPDITSVSTAGTQRLQLGGSGRQGL